MNARARARTHTHTQWTGTLGEFVELHEPRCDQIEVSCPKTGCTWTGRHCVCCVCCVCVCMCNKIMPCLAARELSLRLCVCERERE